MKARDMARPLEEQLQQLLDIAEEQYGQGHLRGYLEVLSALVGWLDACEAEHARQNAIRGRLIAQADTQSRVIAELEARCQRQQQHIGVLEQQVQGHHRVL